MVIPQKRILGFWFNQKYDASKHQEYADDMLTARFIDVYHSLVFFWTLGSELLSATLNYLERELKTMSANEQATLAHELNSEKSGGGIAQSMDSLKATLQNMTRLLNTDYINVLPILHSNKKKTKLN